MFKKIVLFALLLLPIGVMAQEKIAYINSGDIIQVMPEFVEMQSKLKVEEDAVTKELQIFEEEYSKKMQALMAEANELVETIRTRRMTEIQGIEERAQTFAQQSQQRLAQMQQEMFAPIQEKVTAAIKAVGDQNNFAYILDLAGNGTVVYTNPNSVDATPLVKAQLGIK